MGMPVGFWFPVVMVSWLSVCFDSCCGLHVDCLLYYLVWVFTVVFFGFGFWLFDFEWGEFC